MAIDKEKIFTRDKKVDSGSGVDVRETTQLKGDAKDSFQGSNSTVQYETTNPKMGTLGGRSEDHG